MLCIATLTMESGLLGRHRLAALVGAGLVAGIALETVPARRWRHAGAAVFGTAAWLARSAVGPALTGALLTRVLARTNGSAPHLQANQRCNDYLRDEC